MTNNNPINTDNLTRCITALEISYTELQKQNEKTDPIAFDIYRNSAVKAFEMTVEQAGKLLRKALKPHMASDKAVYTLSYKDTFKVAQQQGILEQDFIERWFIYRDNRNNTAHDYGEFFATQTMGLLEQFISDAKTLRDSLNP